MTLRVEVLTGTALGAALDDLARLRIEVFRDWPYLYDGDLGYERRYLDSYRSADGATLVGAFDGDRLVGAATATRLTDHADDFARAFDRTPYDLGDIYYCAESVLLPAYRGQGIGHLFFDRREARARALGCRYSAFCAVIRPDNHPARPAEYVPLDGFWTARGYGKLDGAIAEYHWRDIGEAEQTPKPLQFWIKDLT